jgi:hypothetical protein
MKRWKIIAAVVAILLLGGIAIVVHRMVETTRNAYAKEWIGAIVVDYLRRNDDHWPQSWDDLRPIYEEHVKEVGNRPFTFEKLRSYVVVQWNVEVDRLRKASSASERPPFPVIYSKDGTDSHWGGFEPNEMVWRQLHRPDPYQVYSDLLGGESGASGQRRRRVVTSETGWDSRYNHDIESWLREGVARDTIDDFIAQNKASVVLKDRFSEDVGVLLVSRREIRKVFSQGSDDGWKEFYKRFPESGGTTNLSRVGFSKDGKQALVYIGRQAFSLAGRGRLAILSWNGKNWKLTKYIELWVS